LIALWQADFQYSIVPMNAIEITTNAVVIRQHHQNGVPERSFT
jgi:hypothetical protein